MPHENIEDSLQEVFREVFEDDSIELRREMTARDIDGWDSLMHVQLLVNIEREFSIRFKSSQVAGLKDVGEMVDLIASMVDASS